MEPTQCSETLLNIASETNGIEDEIISQLEWIEAKLFGSNKSNESVWSSAWVPQEPMLEKSLLSARKKANIISSIVWGILNRI